MEIEQKVKQIIRDVPNFPKEGIIFKDLTPLLKDYALSKELVDKITYNLQNIPIDAIVCLESRGFWFGAMIANALKKPMIPIRKAGKLPYQTVFETYELEYGSAKIEMHIDAIELGWQVLIHDDLLATGGTAEAASRLVQRQGGSIAGYSFIVELDFLQGREKLKPFNDFIDSIVHF